MRSLALAAGLAALTFATGACTTPGSAEQPASMVETISGELIYRERIALPPGARMEIAVMDITRGADDGLILSRLQSEIGRRSVPIPFTIDVSRRNLSAGPLYGLRAFITDPQGRTLFGTASPVLLDLDRERVDTGTIMLTMTSPDDPGLQGVAGIQAGEWRVTQMNMDVAPAPSAPTMTFGPDGRLHGSTGCNSFSTEYELDGTAIGLAPIAVNLRACEPPLLEQERRFLEVLNSAQRVSLDEEGRLVVEGGNGRLVAERAR